mmetsp:Transcript_22990/g.55051  ORF Transcript_22990/g.55051 Transcript_22990/m.55051 type:complete len:307 (+) Transcript_22990:281-1201(+)
MPTMGSLSGASSCRWTSTARIRARRSSSCRTSGWATLSPIPTASTWRRCRPPSGAPSRRAPGSSRATRTGRRTRRASPPKISRRSRPQRRAWSRANPRRTTTKPTTSATPRRRPSVRACAKAGSGWTISPSRRPSASPMPRPCRRPSASSPGPSAPSLRTCGARSRFGSARPLARGTRAARFAATPPGTSAAGAGWRRQRLRCSTCARTQGRCCSLSPSAPSPTPSPPTRSTASRCTCSGATRCSPVPSRVAGWATWSRRSTARARRSRATRRSCGRSSAPCTRRASTAASRAGCSTPATARRTSA